MRKVLLCCALFACALGQPEVPHAQSPMLADSQHLSDLMGVSSTSRDAIDLGRGLNQAGLSTNLQNCITHDGKRRVIDGTGIRVELFVDLSDRNSVVNFFGAIGLAPPAIDSPTYDQETTDNFKMLGRWLVGPQFSIAVVLTRDDGIYTFDRMRFDESAIANETPGTNVLQWVRQRCGGVVANRWREQARVVLLYRSTARISYSDPAWDDARRLLRRTGNIATSAALSNLAEQTGSGDKEIARFQADAVNFQWPSNSFWQELLSFGPVEVGRMSVSGGEHVRIDSQVVSDVARVPQSFAATASWVQGAPARATHVGLVPIEEYLPEYLKTTDAATKNGAYFAHQAVFLQANALRSIDARFRNIWLIEQIEQELQGNPRSSRPSPLLTENVRSILGDALKQLRRDDASQLDSWHDARLRVLDHVSETDVQNAVVGFDYSANIEYLPIPTWTPSGIKGRPAGERSPLPPGAASRLGLLWTGDCKSDFALGSGVDASTFLSNTTARKNDLLRSSYGTGFLLAKSEGFLPLLGYGSTDGSPIPIQHGQWDGEQYKHPFGHRPSVTARSDVFVLLDYAYPIDQYVEAQLVWSDQSTNTVTHANLAITQWESQRNPRQGLFGILPCVGLDDLLQNRVTLRFSDQIGLDRSSDKAVSWMLTDSASDAVEGAQAVPQWFLDELRNASIPFSFRRYSPPVLPPN